MEQYILKSALVAEIERRIKTNKECMLGLRNLDYYQGKVDALKDTLSSLDTLEVKEVQEKPVSIWHDASERAEKGRLYLYLTNQNVVDINRSEGKDFPDYCERWAYIEDLLKL